MVYLLVGWVPLYNAREAHANQANQANQPWHGNSAPSTKGDEQKIDEEQNMILMLLGACGVILLIMLIEVRPDSG